MIELNPIKAHQLTARVLLRLENVTKEGGMTVVLGGLIRTQPNLDAQVR